ncbi:MAG: TonB-dependent receptor [Gammaproteobacteria bacterium]|nr:TonB-dependent receptor [Gammaproteobacteria bacterium]
MNNHRGIRRALKRAANITLAVSGVAAPLITHAAGVPTLDVVEVKSSAENLIGTADSANQGTVLKKQLDARTIYRQSELMETVPGLIATQHSGEGKAGQYYVRGINLDHGTDLRTSVDGMLVNQRSHGHGQGWTDLNFLIPELVSGLQYKKGPYYAEEGDFSSAGSINIGYLDTLPQGISSIGIGQQGYRRLLLADSPKLGAGNLLYAAEVHTKDGPWINPDDYRRFNAVLRYSQGDDKNRFNVTAMAYRGLWNATDQIPQRAVDSGAIPRLGAVDPSDGGDVYRYSLSTAWQRMRGNGITRANAYVIQHDLNLYSNFTYCLDDIARTGQCLTGDQFYQPDKRVMSATNISQSWLTQWGERDVENTIGLQLQNDNIFNGLMSTKQRQVWGTTRRDQIIETSAAVYLQNSTRWAEKFRTVAGLRSDFYRFKVNSNNAANSGTENASITNPKLSMIFGPWAKTEYYINLGGGFRSNDARGTTITVDPKSSLAVDRVTPLVRTKGADIGLRTAIIPGLQSTFTVYQLESDSELLFLGDAGTTEAGRPSRRTGFEFANYYQPTDWLVIDADIAYAKARFRDDAPEGNRIPGAPEGIASLAALVDNIGPWFGSLHLRHFGPRALVEDNSVRSSNTTLLNGQVGYKLRKNVRVALQIFNLLNRKADAITYYYESQLANEAAPVSDKHLHPVESRSLRLTLTSNF